MGHWQFEEAPDKWCAFPPDVGHQILEAYHSGQAQVMYSSDKSFFEVDFNSGVQKNRLTGAHQAIRWVVADTPSAYSSIVAGWADGAVKIAQGACSDVGFGIASMHETQYQWQLKNGAWADYDEEDEKSFIAAWSSGKDVVRYSAWGMKYEMDFVMMCQTNLVTKQKRLVRVRPKNERNFDGPSSLAIKVDGSLDGGKTPSEQIANDPSSAPERSSKASTEQSNSPPNSAEFTGSYRRPTHHAATKATSRPSAARGKKWSFNAESAAKAAKPPASSPPCSDQGGDQHRDDAHASPEQGAGVSKSSSRKSWSQQDVLPTLPSNVAWPLDDAAKSAAAVLFLELSGSKEGPPDKRRSTYRSACLSWHPDKNLQQEDLATEVFQFLQALRGWYLAC